MSSSTSSTGNLSAASLPSSAEAYRSKGDLPVISPEDVLEQCGDWSFVVELLEDILKERDAYLESFMDAVDKNDHTKFHKQAHALKGAALNLHLPALSDASKRAEMLGKKLETDPKNEDLLNMRLDLINELQSEYDRLENYIPEAKALAESGEQNGDMDGEGALVLGEDGDDGEGAAGFHEELVEEQH